MRSTTRDLQLVLEPRCWRGVSSSSQTTTSASTPVGQLLQLLELARAEVGARVRRVAVLHERRRRRRRRRCAAARASRRARVLASRALRGHGDDHGALGRVGSRAVAVTGHCRPCVPDGDSRPAAAHARDAQVLLDALDGLAQALVGQRQREAHVALAVRAVGRPGRDHDGGLLEHAARRTTTDVVAVGHRHPDVDACRAGGATSMPTAREGVADAGRGGGGRSRASPRRDAGALGQRARSRRAASASNMPESMFVLSLPAARRSARRCRPRRRRASRSCCSDLESEKISMPASLRARRREEARRDVAVVGDLGVGVVVARSARRARGRRRPAARRSRRRPPRPSGCSGSCRTAGSPAAAPSRRSPSRSGRKPCSAAAASATGSAPASSGPAV